MTFASVLGGLKTRDQPSSMDADDIKQTGCYQSTGLSNLPSDFPGGGNILICIRGVGDYVIQVLVTVGYDPTIAYIRGGVDRTGWTMQTWSKLTP